MSTQIYIQLFSKRFITPPKNYNLIINHLDQFIYLLFIELAAQISFYIQILHSQIFNYLCACMYFGLQIKSIVIKRSTKYFRDKLQKLITNASLVIYLFIHSGYLPFHLYCAINMLYLSVFNLIILLIKIQLPRFCFVGSNSKQISDNSEGQSYLSLSLFRLI